MNDRRFHKNLSISRQKLCGFLLVLILGFSLLSAIVNMATFSTPNTPLGNVLMDTFDVDAERSLPTFYAFYTLQACALLLYAVAHITKISRGKFVRHWQLLSLIFVYLSFDEALSFHERPIGTLQKLLNAEGFLHFAWVIPAAFLLAIFLLGYAKFILALPKATRRLFLIAGSTFVGGALGMEMIGGKILSMQLPRLAYILAVTSEEFLEMLGIVIFIYALLSYLKSKLLNVEILFTD